MNYNKIKELADLRKIKMTELSDKIGLSKTGLYKTISNTSMKVDTLEAISKELGVSITHFFDDVMTLWEEHNAEYLSEVSRLREENEMLSHQLKELEILKLKNDNLNKDLEIQTLLSSRWQLRINAYRDFRKLFEQTKLRVLKKRLNKEEKYMVFVLDEYAYFLRRVIDRSFFPKEEKTSELLERLMGVMGYEKDIINFLFSENGTEPDETNNQT